MERSFIATHFNILFPIFFVVVWCGGSVLVSRMSGWHRLAESFPARGRPSGKRFRLQGAQIGGVTYSACLTIHSSREGLYLSVLLPFRLGHPPLFIPRSAIHNVTTRQFFMAASVAFEVGSPGITQLELSKKVFDAHTTIL